jgi:hypothetical protein
MRCVLLVRPRLRQSTKPDLREKELKAARRRDIETILNMLGPPPLISIQEWYEGLGDVSQKGEQLYEVRMLDGQVVELYGVFMRKKVQSESSASYADNWESVQ